MKIDGIHELHAPRERVYQALTDPEVLRRSLPGCERLEKTGEDAYSATLRAGVGAIKAVFTGSVRIEERQPPQNFRLVVEGKGSPGFVKGTGVLDLEKGEGMTILRYEGDVQVGGMIAGVGQRVIQATAKMMASQFFTAIEAEAQTERNAPPG